ncbi:KH domain-containing protein [bacterium]|nr:KH domain-containing protein [bacterium]
MNEEYNNKVKEFISQIVTQLGYTPESIDVTSEEDTEKTNMQIMIKGTEMDLLIGYHGKNLQALHQLTVSYLKRVFPADKRVSLFLDIGDYFEKQNTKVREMVAQAVEEVKLLDEPYEFKPMPPRLRRIVHVEAEKHTEVRTESTGEGMDRRVIIYPGNAKETPAT